MITTTSPSLTVVGHTSQGVIFAIPFMNFFADDDGLYLIVVAIALLL